MFHALISLVLTLNVHAATHQRHRQLITPRPTSTTSCQWVQTATIGSVPRCV
jgi:hypothetical protein